MVFASRFVIFPTALATCWYGRSRLISRDIRESSFEACGPLVSSREESAYSKGPVLDYKRPAASVETAAVYCRSSLLQFSSASVVKPLQQWETWGRMETPLE